VYDTSCSDALGPDQFVLNGPVYRRKGKAGNSRDLGGRVGIVLDFWRHIYNSTLNPEEFLRWVGSQAGTLLWVSIRRSSDRGSLPEESRKPRQYVAGDELVNRGEPLNI